MNNRFLIVRGRTNFISVLLFNNFFSFMENSFKNKYRTRLNYAKRRKHTSSDNIVLNKKLKMKNENTSLNKIKTDLSSKYNVTFLTPPAKSKSDKKAYLVMKLSNGLTALLISDVENLIPDSDVVQSSGHGYDGDGSEPSSTCSDHSSVSSSSSLGNLDENLEVNEIVDDSDQDEKLAACALTVGVGSFSDPEEIPGLAHFLEHMLFMGSEKFPKENEFDSFISNKGGSDNASTECEYTTYYFDIPDRHLGGALNRFANFFTQPLMKRDSMTREREAVESEFKMHLSSDMCRTEQIFCSTAPLNNPVHKFMWGNLITLQHNITDDNLYKALRDFWGRHYSAHRMTVAVQARLPLNVMGLWIAEYFSQIPNNNMPPDSFSNVNPPFRMDLFNKMYTVLPVKEKHRLQITWAFPPIIHLYKSKPMSYLSFLIGHEGEGSLISYLLEKLWALHITAGNANDGIENNSIYSLFSIDIDLTDEGLQNIENILKLVFSYIKLLQNSGPIKSIFKEIQLVDEISFRFSQEKAASDYVESLSQNMQLYPSEDYITCDKLLFEYNPHEITKLLNGLTIDYCNIMILSKKSAKAVDLDHIEPWFSTKYNLQDIPENLKHELKNCKPDPNFFLPNPNKFIASDFHILSEPSGGVPEYPKKIVCNKNIEVWYKQDVKFKLPFGYIKIYFISPIATTMPQNSVMCDLFVSIFNILLVKETYPAVVAGLDHSLTCGDNGLNLTVNGFNHKLHLLLETLLKEIMLLKENISPGLFEAVKEEQIKKYTNKTLKPSILGNELRLSILCKPYWTSVEKLEAIPYITLAKLKEFSNNFFENLYIKCLIQGNISKEEALRMSDSITKTITYSPLLSGCYPVVRVRKIPMGERILKVQSFNKEDTNCFVKNYYQCNISNTENSCMTEVLMLLMHEPLFDTLRTQEQLGYDVDCGIKDTFGVLGFTMAVKSQAEKFTVEHVEKRMTEFLKKLSLEFINTIDFENIKDSLKILKLQADTHLSEEVQRNWAEIVSNEYEFDRVKKEIKCIESLKKQDVHTFFKSILDEPKDNIHSSLCLRKLSIRVDGTNSGINAGKMQNNIQIIYNSQDEIQSILRKKVKTDEKIGTYIRDITEFKNSLYIFPVKALLPK